ncbi:MAG TPA: POTRA domain-containing protein [Anaeromyxobacteraceae bacterium]|nr:POTRA domain-containing protein [Anaeromyxobacteraceae bacterium]
MPAIRPPAAPTRARLLPALALAAVPILAAAAEPAAPAGVPVARIEVTGNTRTRTDVIVRALRLEAGDVVSVEALPELRRRVLNLRLFSAATVELRPAEDGAVLEVAVEERWTLLPFPFFSSSGGRWQAGLFAVESNLLGWNKTLVAGGMVSNRGGSAFGLYRDPAIRGSRWTSALSLSWSDTDRERVRRDVVVDSYTDQRFEASAVVGRRLTPELEVSAGGFSVINRPEPREGFALAPPRGEVHGVQLAVEYEGQDYRDWFDEGLAARLRVQEGLEPLGSTRTFRRVSLAAEYTRALPLAHTFTVRASGDLVEGDPVLDALQLGARPGSRGFTQNGLWAEEAATLGAEYQVPIWRPRWGTLTANLFVDLGVARWLGHGTDWAAPGLGLRVYLRNVAIPALGVDVTRAPDTGELVTSVAAGFSL